MNVFKKIVAMYEDHKTRSFIVALCNSVDYKQVVIMNDSFILQKERCAITNIRLYHPGYVSDNNTDYATYHKVLKSGKVLKLKGGRATEWMTPQNVGVKSPTMKCWVCPEAMGMLVKFKIEVLIPNMELEEGKQMTIAPKIRVSSMTRKPIGTLAELLSNPKPQQRKRVAKQGVAKEYREVTV